MERQRLMTREEQEQQALFEAAGWMARLTGGPPSDETLSEFKGWLSAGLLHARAMETVEAQWRLSGRLAAAVPPLAARRLPKARLAGFAAAAAAVLAVAFTLARPLFGEALYATGIGDMRDVALADGSVIHLGADSAMRVRFQPLSRGVELVRGRAEFTVAHNRWRPFTVAAGPAEIRVTGTHFLVQRDGQGASAYLISGSIELRDAKSGRREADLHPGTEASISPAGKVLVQSNDGVKEKAWLSGKLLFDQTALADALDQFRPYGPVAVRLSSEDLRGLKISGLYSSNDLDGFLRSVATVYPLLLTSEADGSVLVERNPGKK